MVRRFFASERGQGLVEYSLILLLVAIVVFVTLALIGPRVSAMFGSIYNSLTHCAGFPGVQT